MYQYYIVEIKKTVGGEFDHTVHYAFDADQLKARLKAESKYYEVLSGAAVSEFPMHAAILFESNCSPIMNTYYIHEIEEQEPQEAEE